MLSLYKHFQIILNSWKEVFVQEHKRDISKYYKICTLGLSYIH